MRVREKMKKKGVHVAKCVLPAIASVLFWTPVSRAMVQRSRMGSPVAVEIAKPSKAPMGS